MSDRGHEIERASKAIEQVVRRLTEHRPAVPELANAVLPPPPADGRFSRTARTLTREGLSTFFADAQIVLGTAHDATLLTLQGYLKDIEGKAFPTLDDNQFLAKEVMALADTYGAKLFCRNRDGDVTPVRIKAIGVPRLKNQESLAAKAGKFIVTTTVDGVTRNVVESVTFPATVAARDSAQAERLFAQRDVGVEDE